LVLGDHLARKNPLYEKLNAAPRTIYNRLFTTDTFIKAREDILHEDWFPTILQALGFSFKSTQLGLGFKALCEGNGCPPAPPLKERQALLKRIKEQKSALYTGFWLEN